MWSKPPFYLGDGYAVEVSNLETARAWYREKLDFRDAKLRREYGDSGKPFIDLQLSNENTVFTLVQMEAGGSEKRLAGLTLTIRSCLQEIWKKLIVGSANVA